MTDSKAPMPEEPKKEMCRLHDNVVTKYAKQLRQWATTVAVERDNAIVQRDEYERRVERLVTAAPVAYAVRNDQGYWVGIWNTREEAERVRDKGVPSHDEIIVELYASRKPS